MKNKLFILPIKAYQYISKMLPKSCRYYPTCSEYAIWQFETNSTFKAFFSSVLRILRCNQLFSGGIDYPIIRYKAPKIFVNHKLHLKKSDTFSDIVEFKSEKFIVKYWIVPKDDKRFFVIKDFNATELKIK